MSQTKDRSTSALTAALWLAAGAAAGVVVGVALADRFAGSRRLLSRFNGVLRAVHDWTSTPRGEAAPEETSMDDDELDDEFDAEFEDDGEGETDDEFDDGEFDDEDDDEDDDGDDGGDDDGDDDEIDNGHGDKIDDEAEDDGAMVAHGIPRIDERVLTAFEQDPVLSLRAIEIDEPEPATIVLAGRVPSEQEAKHAVTIALGVPGVERVEDCLSVGGARSRPAPRSGPDA